MLTPASVADIRQQLHDIFLSNPKTTISEGVIAISLGHLDSIITAYETQNNIQLMSTEDMCALKVLMAENPERKVTPEEISEYITGIHASTPVETDQPQSRHLSDSRRPSEPRRQRSSHLGPKDAVLGPLHGAVKPNLFRRSKLQLHAEEVGTAIDNVLRRIGPQFEDLHHQLDETRSALTQCESKLEGIRLRLDDVQSNFESSHSELNACLANMANRQADIQTALDSTISQQENEHANLSGTIEEIQSDIRSLRRDVVPLAECQKSLDELILQIDCRRVVPEFSSSRRNSKDDEDITMDGHKSLNQELKDADIKARLVPAPSELVYTSSARYDDMAPTHGCSDPLPAYSDEIQLSPISYNSKQLMPAFTVIGAWALGMVLLLELADMML
ncbi:hypothetical protein EYR36_001604 [Pleurotus pulmonarius]|nr:hypothetical protein EYR36_001604 [Pleurotus pulmonarius]